MTRKTIWYWIGGADRGRWQHTLGYSDEMMDDIRRMGYMAFKGTEEIGPPCDPLCDDCRVTLRAIYARLAAQHAIRQTFEGR